MTENAILEFEVSVTAKASQETEDLLNRLEKHKDTLQEQNKQQEESTEGKTDESKDQNKKSKTTQQTTKPNDVISSGTVGNYQKDPFFAEPEKEFEESEQLKKDVLNTLNKLDSKGLTTLSNFATNPTGATMNALTTALTAIGPEGAALVSIIGLAISAPQVIQAIIKALSVKGGPLNRDWKRLIGKEVDAGLARNLVIQRQLGVDQVILNQQKGYVPNNTNWTYNSYFKINASRLSRIGLTDRSTGVLTV